MRSPRIPAAASDLTAGWFSAALNRPIESVELERLGGLASIVYRARLGHAGELASVIVKLPLVPHLPWPGRGVGAYEREIRFYRELAGEVAIPTPHVYWSDFDAASGHFVLVLEDFPHLAARSDDSEATPEQAAAIVDATAQLHAAWWDHPRLESCAFLRRLPEFMGMVETQLPRALPMFLERFDGSLQPAERGVFEALPGRFRAAVEPLAAAPRTLVHNDLSLRNMLLGDGNAPEVVLIDWQLAQHNAAVRDLSFFIGASLGAGRRSRDEGTLLARYLERLNEAGVTNYGARRLEEDYRRSVICDFGRMVMSGGQATIASGMEAAVRHQLVGRAGSAAELDLLALL